MPPDCRERSRTAALPPKTHEGKLDDSEHEVDDDGDDEQEA